MWKGAVVYATASLVLYVIPRPLFLNLSIKSFCGLYTKSVCFSEPRYFDTGTDHSINILILKL